MWQIFEKRTLQKAIRKTPKNIVKQYEIWKRIVELEGPSGLKEIKGFHDEPLKGDWNGFRSSRLTKQWRVIYCVEKEIFSVYVIDINAHNYKRKR